VLRVPCTDRCRRRSGQALSSRSCRVSERPLRPGRIPPPRSQRPTGLPLVPRPAGPGSSFGSDALTDQDNRYTKHPAMGRPPSAEAPRDVAVLVRVLPRERDAWRRAAARAGVSLGAWLREIANAAAAASSKKGKKR